jgi:hypothetical protein
MKTIIQATASLILLASSVMAQNAPNGDPFAQDETGEFLDLNKLSSERLKTMGITIEGISPNGLGFIVVDEAGPKEEGDIYSRDDIFVRVRFDCSKLAKEQFAHMNLHLIGKDKIAITTQHVTRKKVEGEKLEMIFFIDEKLVEHSYLSLVVSDLQTEAQKRAGTIRAVAQRLEAKRLMELAKKNVVAKEFDE